MQKRVPRLAWLLMSAIVAAGGVLALADPPEGRSVSADAQTVHLFRFNEGKGDETKDAVTGKTILLQGHQWGEGVEGKALVWTQADGMGKSDIPSPPPGTGFTMEFWFRLDAFPDPSKNTSPYEFDSAALLAGHWYAFKVRGRDLIATLCFEGTFTELHSTRPVKTGEWTHVAVIHDPDLRLFCLYVDHRLDNWMFLHGYPPALRGRGKEGYIGTLGLRGWTPKVWKFIGALDNLRISNTIRPEYERPPLQSVFVQYVDSEKLVRVIGQNRDTKEPASLTVDVGPNPLTRSVLPGKSEWVDVSMEASAGKVVQVRARMGQAGRAAVEIERDIRISDIAASGHFVRDGIIHCNGKPFFPRMMYFVYEDHFKTVKDLGCNMVYAGIIASGRKRVFALTDQEQLVPQFKRMLQDAEKQGLAVMGTIGVGTPGGDKLRKLLGIYREHKNIAMYYIADEPAAVSNPDKSPLWQSLCERYQIVKEHPGAAPGFLVFNNLSAAWVWSQCCDIVACDPYVTRGGFPEKVQRFVQKAREVAGGKKATLAVLGAYSYNKAKPDYPFHEELRAQVFVALAEGARGIGYYTFDEPGWYMPDHPDMMSSIRKINDELIKLNDILLAADSGIRVASGRKELSHTLRRHNEKLYLILANAGDEAIEDTLVVDATSLHVTGARGLLSQQSYPVSTRGVTIHLPRLGADVIELEQK